MFVVDVRAMMRRSDRMGLPSGPVTCGASRNGVAGFAPGTARELARGSARLESPVRERALWLLLGVLSSLVVVGCGGPHDRAATVPAPVRATPRADSREAVIHGPRPSAVPVAARRVGERFLHEYVAFLYGRGSVDELDDATRELRRELRRARLRVPPARAARTPTIMRLQSAKQSPATIVITAIVDDGDLAAYPITALIEQRAGSWRVTRLAND